MSFLVVNKTLRLNNLKTRTAMNVKISVFVNCVEAIVYLLLHNSHDCTFEGDKIGTKNFARLYVGVPIAEKNGPKRGTIINYRFMYLSTAVKYSWS